MVYFAAAMIVAGVAMFVAAPLVGGLLPFLRKKPAEIEAERIEHERGLAVQALRELEFDRAMGKLSDADYESVRPSLEHRALAAMKSLESLRASEQTLRPIASTKPVSHIEAVRSASRPTQISVVGSPRISSARHLRFCPQCGTRTVPDARFCGECGAALKTVGRATGWNE